VPARRHRAGTAETVAAGTDIGPAEVDDRLGDLVDQSMLLVESGPFGRRFRPLETIRQFAAERLSERGESDAVGARHASWCLDRLAGIEQLLAGPAEVEGVARLDELWPNLRAAFEWAGAGGDRHLAHALVRPVVTEVVRRSRIEIGDWVERILALTPGTDQQLLGFCLAWAAHRYKLRSDPEAYERLVARRGGAGTALAAHALASARQDNAELAATAPAAIAELRRQGEHGQAEQFELDVDAGLLFSGRVEQADAVADELVERYRSSGPPSLLNWAPMLRGYSALRQQDDRLAEKLLDAALGIDLPERSYSPNRPLEARRCSAGATTGRARHRSRSWARPRRPPGAGAHDRRPAGAVCRLGRRRPHAPGAWPATVT
jgi:hypothetical protein